MRMKGSASSVDLSEKGAKTGGGQMYGGVQALPLVKPIYRKKLEWEEARCLEEDRASL